jgi:Peptidase_C39 like family
MRKSLKVSVGAMDLWVFPHPISVLLRCSHLLQDRKGQSRTLLCVLRVLLFSLSVALAQGAGSETETRGRQFVAFHSFGAFATAQAAGPDQLVLTSPVIRSALMFNEVVVSWNAELPADGFLSVEGRAVYPEQLTKYYTFGLWSPNPARHPRQSVAGQGDEAADVSTDTLVLNHPANGFQLRVTFNSGNSSKAPLKFLGICFTDSQTSLHALPPNRQAWGRVIPVPERSQMVYPGGNSLCSPTTVSMLLSYWAQRLKRPELDRPVPEIANAVYDSQWQGAGNWPFNMAYAGAFPGIRAYVTRLSDVSELEDWIVQKIPVGLSLDYDRLRAKGPGPNGHLVALVGFTKQGDPIINDPGTSEHVRKIFPRKNLCEAWACSRNTVYLIYPEKLVTPRDRFAHWDPRAKN